MAFFFLVVGLEAKRELGVGQLRERRRLAALAVMSGIAMACAVGLYLAFNAGGDGAHGWGAAMSTDTAFVLGVSRWSRRTARAYACGCLRWPSSTTSSRSS
jgi:Na+/H+ antiporter NhaA